MSDKMKKMLDMVQQCQVIDMPDGTFAVFLVTEGFPTKDLACAFMQVLKQSSMIEEFGKVIGSKAIVTKDLT